MRIGIDLGGTKIESAALDPAGQVVARRRAPTPDRYETLLDVLTRQVAELEVEAGQCTVGIGTPGAERPDTGRMDNAHNTALQGRTFSADLAARLDREVRVANDAHCFALSEAAADGAAAGAPVVFGVIIGTGTGGGVVVDGRVLHGANGNAGEWGHNPLPWSTPEEQSIPACYCGRTTCIEQFLSGPGLTRDHLAVTGDSRTAEQVAQGAREGDAACEATMARYVDRMARSLASVINFLDPDVIVLGGGVSNIERLYREVPPRWHEYVFGEAPRTRLVANRHGASSGLRGAAWLWGAVDEAG